MTPIEKDLLLKKISKLGALPHFTDSQRTKMLRQKSERIDPPTSLELYSNREAVHGSYEPTKKVNKLS